MPGFKLRSTGIVSMLSRKTLSRLRDIVEDAGRIRIFIDGMTLNDFLANEQTVFAVERLLQRITEAAVQIDAEDAESFGFHLPVKQMRALGNRLRHEYRDVDRPAIFELARVDVPLLSASVELMLDSFERP